MGLRVPALGAAGEVFIAKAASATFTCFNSETFAMGSMTPPSLKPTKKRQELANDFADLRQERYFQSHYKKGPNEGIFGQNRLKFTSFRPSKIIPTVPHGLLEIAH